MSYRANLEAPRSHGWRRIFPIGLAVSSLVLPSVVTGQEPMQFVDDPTFRAEPGYDEHRTRFAKYGVPLMIATHDGIKSGLVCTQTPPAIFDESVRVKSIVFRRQVEHRTVTSRARYIDCNGAAVHYLQRMRLTTRTGAGNYPTLVDTLSANSDIYVEQVKRYKIGAKGWPVVPRVTAGETTQGFRISNIKTPRIACKKVLPITIDREYSSAYILELFFDPARVTTPRVSLPASEAYRVYEKCDPLKTMTRFINPRADLSNFID